eukprot:8914842-Pyramimonas_sp.AAC.1
MENNNPTAHTRSSLPRRRRREDVDPNRKKTTDTAATREASARVCLGCRAGLVQLLRLNSPTRGILPQRARDYLLRSSAE